MSEWNLFQFEDARPERVISLDESHRKVLERQVALHVSNLLRFYAKIEEVQVDNSDCVEVDCSATFQMLELDRTVLGDDTEILVEQMPETPDGYWNERGVHYVAHHTDDDELLRGYIVRDSAFDDDFSVATTTRAEVPLDELVELCDALQVIYDACELGEDAVTPNDPPFVTHDFPRRARDDEFSAIIGW